MVAHIGPLPGQWLVKMYVPNRGDFVWETLAHSPDEARVNAHERFEGSIKFEGWRIVNVKRNPEITIVY
jgi:hypothetical protein